MEQTIPELEIQIHADLEEQVVVVARSKRRMTRNLLTDLVVVVVVEVEAAVVGEVEVEVAAAVVVVLEVKTLLLLFDNLHLISRANKTIDAMSVLETILREVEEVEAVGAAEVAVAVAVEVAAVVDPTLKDTTQEVVKKTTQEVAMEKPVASLSVLKVKKRFKSIIVQNQMLGQDVQLHKHRCMNTSISISFSFSPSK
jgi:hypothetical protein